MAKSTAFKISVLFKPAAVSRIHTEINPPIEIDTIVSKFANLKSLLLSHLLFTNATCRKILYGTTVVPIKPAMVKILSGGKLKRFEDESNESKSTPTIKTVNTKEKLIIKTRIISIFSKILLFPKIIKGRAKPPERILNKLI